MKDKEENPFVHPVFVPSYNKDGVMSEPKLIEGIRLRDKIAIAAMEAIIINPLRIEGKAITGQEDISKAAYLIADAMLKARNNSSAD